MHIHIYTIHIIKFMYIYNKCVCIIKPGIINTMFKRVVIFQDKNKGSYFPIFCFIFPNSICLLIISLSLPLKCKFHKATNFSYLLNVVIQASSVLPSTW